MDRLKILLVCALLAVLTPFAVDQATSLLRAGSLLAILVVPCAVLLVVACPICVSGAFMSLLPRRE